MESERASLITALNERAAAADWSQRELAFRSGFKWTTWRRLRSGGGSAAVMLPKLRAAAARLGI